MTELYLIEAVMVPTTLFRGMQDSRFPVNSWEITELIAPDGDGV